LARGLGGQPIELFGGSAALVSHRDQQLPFFSIGIRVDTGQSALGRLKRPGPQHRTDDPLYCSMVLLHLVPLHCVVEVFDLLDDDRRAMPRAVTPDGRAIASVPSMVIGSGIPCRSLTRGALAKHSGPLA
jgi:hypothetical protein